MGSSPARSDTSAIRAASGPCPTNALPWNPSESHVMSELVLPDRSALTGAERPSGVPLFVREKAALTAVVTRSKTTPLKTRATVSRTAVTPTTRAARGPMSRRSQPMSARVALRTSREMPSTSRNTSTATGRTRMAAKGDSGESPTNADASRCHTTPTTTDATSSSGAITASARAEAVDGERGSRSATSRQSRAAITPNP